MRQARQISVLDHGYVKFIEPWGTGESGVGADYDFDTRDRKQADYEVGIVEAARQSTQGSFRGWEPAPCDCGYQASVVQGFKEVRHAEGCASVKNPGDKKLLNFLYTKGHSTPFEFAGAIFEIQAPIMVFREWQRHRTQSYSEASARYAPLPDLYYHISAEAVIERAKIAAAGTNRQATGVAEINEEAIKDWISFDQGLSDTLEHHYQRGLSIGVPKELARKKMPVDHYSRMRASANLRNWLAFMTLRMDPNAQWEIRQYANAVSTFISEVFPQTHKLFTDSLKHK